MQNRSIQLFITLVAVAVIGIRVYKPDLTLDATTLTLLALAVLPWLSPLVKSFEGLGFKVVFQDPERTPRARGWGPERTEASAGYAFDFGGSMNHSRKSLQRPSPSNRHAKMFEYRLPFA